MHNVPWRLTCPEIRYWQNSPGSVHSVLPLPRQASHDSASPGAAWHNGAVATDAAHQTATRDAVLSASGGLLQDGRLMVTQQACDTVANAAAWQNAASGPGGAGHFVRYTLTYQQPSCVGDWPTMLLSFFGSSSAIPATFVHTSTIMVTNEPFQS